MHNRLTCFLAHLKGGNRRGGRLASRQAPPRARRGQELDWTKLIFDLIDLRSFSNLWYWIALAVTWSSASHWVLGVPFDMVLRARRLGGQSEADLADIVRVNVSRILYIVEEAGHILTALVSFGLTSLILLGFVYGSEFCQALVLLLLPLSVVGMMTVSTARRIRASGDTGEALHRRLSLHRVTVQVIGMISIFITAFWGMLQNFNISVLPG